MDTAWNTVQTSVRHFSYFVVLKDDTPPTMISLPPNLVVEAEGPLGAQVVYIATGADDIDGPVPVTCDWPSGRTFPIGTTTVTCTAMDVAGNVGQASFDVAVLDTAAPILTVPVDMTAEATGPSGALVTFAGSAVDLIDGTLSVTCNPPSGFTFPLGDSIIDCQASDMAGNTAAASFTVHVVDSTPPSVGANPDLTREATGPGGTVVSYVPPSATDLVDPSPTVVCLPASGSLFVLGTATVACAASDAAGNTVSSTFLVHVVDTTPPTITVPSDMTAIATGPSGASVSFEVQAADLVDGPVSVTCVPVSGSLFPLGTTTVTCTAHDAHGNAASASFEVSMISLDSDGDGLADVFDACPTLSGPTSMQGCPFGVQSLVVLHIVDQAKSGACPDGAGSCQFSLEGVDVRVFDRNELNGLQIALLGGGTITLSKNPDGSLYDDLFESPESAASALAAPFGCKTDVGGTCVAGVKATGDYLTIVKYVDPRTAKSVYMGKPLGASGFSDTNGDGLADLVVMDFQVLEVIKRDGSVQYSGGSKTIVRGSYLEIVYPDFAVWEDAVSGFAYPFIFTSDSDWAVDVCSRVPVGYTITGVYDENGNLLGTDACVQTFVSGETKVIAFNVVDIGSPEPEFVAQIGLKHAGRADTTLEIAVPGLRLYEDDVPLVLGAFALVFSVGFAILVPLSLAFAAGRLRVRGRDRREGRTRADGTGILRMQTPSVLDGDHVAMYEHMVDLAAKVRASIGNLRDRGLPVDRHQARIRRVDALLKSHRYGEALQELEDVRAMLLGYASLGGSENLPAFVRARMEAGLGPEWDELGP